MDFTWLEGLKLVATLIGGGLAGSFVTNIFTNRRNAIQPVGTLLTVNYVDLPKIMEGYEAKITITSKDGEDNYQSQIFERLAIVRLQLSNEGNKDFDTFNIGINLPKGTEAIGFQGETSERYHTVKCEQNVSLQSSATELDFEIEHFNRKSDYSITLVTKTDSQDLPRSITLTKKQPVKFVKYVNMDIDEFGRQLETAIGGSLFGSILFAPMSFILMLRRLHKSIF